MTMPPAAIHRDGAWAVPAIAVHRGGAWTTISGDPSPAPEFVPDDGPVRNIASNMGVLQNQVTPGQEGEATATRHTLYANATSLTLGWFGRPNPGFGASQDTTLRAWARRPNAAWAPLTFDGAAETVLRGWDSAATLTPEHRADVYADPLQGPFYVGDVLEVMTWVSTATGANGLGVQGRVDQAYDLGRVRGTPAEVVSAAQFDASGPGTRPSVVLAPSAQAASWALIGDSNSVNPGRSYMSIGFRDRNLPHILNGKHGLSTGDLAGDWWDFQLGEQLRYCDSVYSALLTNDGGAGLAGMQDRLLTVWAKAKAAGVTRWVQATKTPSHAVKEGGGASGDPEPTTSINAWLRDGAPVIDGAAAPTGTTDPGAVRATVITWDFQVIPGDPAHPVGDGWIGDTTYVLETELGSSTWKPEYDANDVNHYYDAAHAAQGEVLAEHLRLMGF